MSNKILSILVVVMLGVVGVVGYFVYNALTGYTSNEPKSNNDIIQVVVDEIKDDNNVKVEKVTSKPNETKVNDDIEKRLKTAITITIDDMFQLDPDVDDVYSYSLEFTLNNINHTEKEIKGFNSILNFKDMFGETVKSIEYKYEFEPIPMKESKRFYAAYDVNQFRDEDMRLYNMPLENITLDYEILSIVFTDGTKW